jgi:hypothetical protein
MTKIKNNPAYLRIVGINKVDKYAWKLALSIFNSKYN